MKSKEFVYNCVTSFIVVVFYLVVTLFYLRGIIFKPGLIEGGDWNWPASQVQSHMAVIRSSFLWTEQTTLQGNKSFLSTDLLLNFVIAGLVKSGVPVAVIQRIFLISIFVFSACGVYHLLRYLGLRTTSSLTGGLVLIVSPIFFNYSIMGWVFVLLATGFLSFSLITFMKAVREKSVVYALLTAVIYALAMLQSQVLFWFPIFYFSLFFYLVRDRASLLMYVKSLGVSFITFLLLTSYLWMPMVVGRDQSLNTGYALTQPSLGTWGHLSYLNIVRSWGSLFNYQFESSYPKTLSVFSFFMPFVVVLAGIVTRRRRLYLSLLLPILVLPSLFTLGVSNVSRLPLSDIYRDIARFTILVSFSYATIFALFFDDILRLGPKLRMTAVIILPCLFFLWSLPFWTGEITGRGDGGSDVRMRSYVFPKEYFATENRLAAEKLDSKVLFLPVSPIVSIRNNPSFRGAYHELWDVFAADSPLPGKYSVYDPLHLGREKTGFLSLLEKSLATNSSELRNYLFVASDINQVVVRKDAVGQGVGPNVIRNLKVDPSLRLDEDNMVIASFRRMMPVAHFYIPQQIIDSDSALEPAMLSSVLASAAGQMVASVPRGRLGTVVTDGLGQPIVELKEVDPTKYRLRFHKVRDPFLLVFSESFDPGWKLFPSSTWKGTNDEGVSSSLEGLDNDPWSATWSEVQEYLRSGYLSAIDGGSPRFISKMEGRTIQNDYLPDGVFYETWLLRPVADGANHFVANGYANAWLVDPVEVCSYGGCRRNSDGTLDFEVVAEFYLQRYLYLGWIVSLATFLGVASVIGVKVLRSFQRKTKGVGKVARMMGTQEKAEDGEISIRGYVVSLKKGLSGTLSADNKVVVLGILLAGWLLSRVSEVGKSPEFVPLFVLISLGVLTVSGGLRYALGRRDNGSKLMARELVVLLTLFILIYILVEVLRQAGPYSAQEVIIVTYLIGLVVLRFPPRVTILVALVLVAAAGYLASFVSEELANQAAAMVIVFLGLFCIEEGVLFFRNLTGYKNGIPEGRRN